MASLRWKNYSACLALLLERVSCLPSRRPLRPMLRLNPYLQMSGRAREVCESSGRPQGSTAPLHHSRPYNDHDSYHRPARRSSRGRPQGSPPPHSTAPALTMTTIPMSGVSDFWAGFRKKHAKLAPCKAALEPTSLADRALLPPTNAGPVPRGVR